MEFSRRCVKGFQVARVSRTVEDQMDMRFAGALIGIDLDNTLVSYDRLFLELALEDRLVPTGIVASKRAVRDAVRLLPDGDRKWQHLQATAYGSAIDRAIVTDGALEFIRIARAHGARLVIVSHKTPFSNSLPAVNLHRAAQRLLLDRKIIGSDAIPASCVYFESTRAKKVARIHALECTHFIDDLEEVFNERAFPERTIPILLASSIEPCTGPSVRAFSSFREIARAFRA
jgi:hypothetical protein